MIYDQIYINFSRNNVEIEDKVFNFNNSIFFFGLNYKFELRIIMSFFFHKKV